MPATHATDAVVQPSTPTSTPSVAQKDASPKSKAKAKAKGKAKAVAKTKAAPIKGKAKAKAKPKAASASLTKAKAEKGNDDKKRKSKAADQKEEEVVPPKKPKGQGQVRDARTRLLQNAASALQTDEKDDEHNDEDDDDDEDDDADDVEKGKRDRCKAQKFDQMLAAGKIPTHIIDMLEEGKKDSKQPRKFKTQIINQLFNRDDKGRLIMQPHAPLFQAWKESHEKTRFKHKETALPKGVFCGKYFNNDYDAMWAAVNAGEVDCVTVSGKEFFCFETVERSLIKEKTSVQHVLLSEKKLDSNTVKQLSSAFDSLAFDFKRVAAPAAPALPASSASSSTDAIVEVQPPELGDELFEKVKPVLEDAKGAMERICKDIQKIVVKFSDDPKTCATLNLVSNYTSISITNKTHPHFLALFHFFTCSQIDSPFAFLRKSTFHAVNQQLNDLSHIMVWKDCLGKLHI